MRRSLYLTFALIPLVASTMVLGAPLAVDKSLSGGDGLAVSSVTLASGSKIVGGGTGLLLQPGVIEVEVPQDATVQQVLLYWNGFHSLADGGDADIEIQGQTVAGTLIGGPQLFFSDNYSYTYRADITGLGLVQPGSNTLTVSGLDFDQIANGASLIAIISDNSVASLDVRDGQDLAYANFAPPRQATVPQTFVFEPSTRSRTADLTIAAGSVQGPVSSDSPVRPNVLRLTVGSEVTVYPYFLGSRSGSEWDHVMLSVEVPAGVTTVVAELASVEDETSAKPASLVWSMAALSIPLPYCGDGFLDAGTAEQCDDSNDVDDDACGNDCVVNFCGDGDVNLSEQCDDGNAVDNDACGNDCVINFCGDGAVNLGESCDDGNGVDDDACGNDCMVNFCGDGDVNLSEQCDDGNGVDGDACGNDCVTNFCGDGDVNLSEQCDDGNDVDGDACGNDCVTNFCGDGEVNLSEQCDDGNGVDDDACGNDCVANFCGDGDVNLSEQCDDGNGVDDDACGNDCVANFCGDGDVNLSEQCDDANADDSDACGNDCLINYCGDGDVNLAEECDDGNEIDEDACGNDCVVSFCGDGDVDLGETCDDGNDVSGDGCDGACQIETHFCGDGVMDDQMGETCDDGNRSPGDGCDSACHLEVPPCGDGVVDAGFGEECDDGNMIDGDGCDASCQIERTCGLELTAQSNPLVVPDTVRVGCETLGRPAQLRFRYTGGDCGGRHDQGRATCDGTLDADQPIDVLAEGRSVGTALPTAYVVVPSKVLPGEVFTVYPNGPVFDEEVSLYLGTGATDQLLGLIASCDEPLRIGDQFGALTLTGYNKRDGNPADVTFTYELVNNGWPITDISIIDPQLGLLANGLSLETGETISFNRTLKVWDSLTEPILAQGLLAGTSEACGSSDHADVFVEGASGTCPDSFGRRPQKLALSYTGDSCAASLHGQGELGEGWDCVGNPGFQEQVRIVVADRADITDPAARIWFDGSLALGGVALIDAGAAGANQLGPQTYIGIGRPGSRTEIDQVLRFDTSCGLALEAGDQFGAIRVESVKLAN